MNLTTAAARNACWLRSRRRLASWTTRRSRRVTAFQAAAGLSGQGACGALSGGLLALSAKRGRDRDKLDRGRFIGNFQKGAELVALFRNEFGGVTCAELQERFTGRTYDMWKPDEYQAFNDARGQKCAVATATVTRWVVEML